jgi:hypothetical protein
MAKGHCEYLVIPLGLSNAPVVSQALVNDVLPDMLNRFIFDYLDDILVFSRTAQEHVLHVQQVLQHLLETQLFVKAEKCELYHSTIRFLGYIIADGSREGESSGGLDSAYVQDAATTFPGIRQTPL